MMDVDFAPDIIDAARSMNVSGINRGTAGNISIRIPGENTFLITPTGMTPDEMEDHDIVCMDLDGQTRGMRKPSSEWILHRDIYVSRTEIGAIIHAHSPFATALACMGCHIPSFHYMIALFGGKDIRCSDYATFGTQSLSDAAVLALMDRKACLLAQHGMVVCGPDLRKTLLLAIEFETLCEQYWRTIQIGTPRILPDEEMERVLQKFSSYGQQ